MQVEESQAEMFALACGKNSNAITLLRKVVDYLQLFFFQVRVAQVTSSAFMLPFKAMTCFNQMA